MDDVLHYINRTFQSLQDTFPRRTGPSPGASHQSIDIPLHNLNLMATSGRLKFIDESNPNITHSNIAKFVKVNASTDPAAIVKFICNKWKLKRPRLLISVTGGATNFPLNGQLRDSFRRGLIKASFSTNAWIITGGTLAGVMKYAGEAVRDYGLEAGFDVVALGIATWGIIDHRDELQKHFADRATPGASSKPFTYKVQQNHSLDPNHTHFILVDSGKNEFGGEVELRGKFIDHLVKKTGVNFNVCVLLEGGPNSLRTVLSAAECNTPVVVIRGTGRIADILADAYDMDMAGSNWEHVTRKRIGEEAGTLKKDLNIEEYIVLIRKCLEKRDTFTFCGLNDSVDLPGAILNGLLKAANADWKAQLKIAMIWNRADIAREKLFSRSRLVNENTDDLFVLFHEAICSNQVDFVKLFLDEGLDVQKYLTQDELESLYNKIDENCLLHNLLAKQLPHSKTAFTLDDVSRLIKSHTFSEYQSIHHRYSQNKYRPDFLKVVDQYVMPHARPYEREESRADSGRYLVDARVRLQSEPTMKRFKYPFQELFLFAVLLDRFDMARLFWERIKEPIAAAMTATNILRTISHWNSYMFHDECYDMEKSAEKMEQLAVGVLDECQDDNAAKTTTLLTARRANWGYASCIKIGFSALNLTFTSHTSVQNVLNKMWLGEISGSASSRLIWFATFFPPAVFFVPFDQDDEKRKATKKQIPPHEELDGFVVEEEVKPDRSMRRLQYQKSLDWEIIDRGEYSNQGNGEADVGEVFPELGNPNRPGVSGLDHVDGTLDGSEFGSVVDEERQRLSCCSRIAKFYTSPMIKFRFHLFSYFVFLGLFSYVMLVSFHEEMSMPEMVLIAWVISLFFEEVRQVVQADSVTVRGKYQAWVSDYWNRMDVLNLFLFLVGEILRFFPSLLSGARIILCVNLMLFYVRILNSFLVIKSLGPKLLMIGRMMVDLLLFIGILLIFLFSYGIASQAILYPDLTDPEMAIRGIIYRGYFQVFGELALSDIEGPEVCTFNATEIAEGQTPCPHNSWAGLTLLAIYMLISNVLLLNLLIAMFSYTFTMVQANTDAFWKYHRYELIKEYIDKPSLFPPFIILSHIVTFLRYLCWKSCTKCGSEETVLDEEAEISLMHWETMQLESFTAKERESMIKDTGLQVRSLNKGLETISSSVSRSQKKMDRIEVIERQVLSLQKSMDQQLAILRDLAASTSHVQKTSDACGRVHDHSPGPDLHSTDL